MTTLVFFIALQTSAMQPHAHASACEAPIEQNAVRRGIDPLLVRMVVRHESAGDPRAIGRNKRGVPKDFGCMQLRIGAATRGLRLQRSALFDPATNVYFGTWFLADQLATCGTLLEALGAYSSGRCHVNGYARRLLREYRKAQRTERRTWSLKGRAA